MGDHVQDVDEVRVENEKGRERESWNGIRLTGLIPYIGVGAQRAPQATKDSNDDGKNVPGDYPSSSSTRRRIPIAPQSRGTVS